MLPKRNVSAGSGVVKENNGTVLCGSWKSRFSSPDAIEDVAVLGGLCGFA
jgi:hypothetical protein